jgi:hypothetical protein
MSRERSEMSSPHLAGSVDFDPAACLELPLAEDEVTRHAVLRRLTGEHGGQPVYLLTEAGRALFCAHLAAGAPWVSWPQDFIEELKPYNNITPPTSLASWQFHMVNALWRFQQFAFRRSDLSMLKEALFAAFQLHPHPDWFPKLGEDTDVIQHVNKSGQWGLAHNSGTLHKADGSSTTYYWLRRPIKYDTVCRKPRPADFEYQPTLPDCNCVQPGDAPVVDPDLAVQRARVIDHLYRTWIEVPVKDWTLEGHRDPDNKNLGVVAQPSEYNRHSKSKWKFDDHGMKECPTVGYLDGRVDRFYPSEHERCELVRIAFDSLSVEVRERLLADLLGSLD